MLVTRTTSSKVVVPAKSFCNALSRNVFMDESTTGSSQVVSLDSVDAYAQRLHARCTRLRHGTRSTGGVRDGVRRLARSSGDGVLQSVGRRAERPSREVGSGRRACASRASAKAEGGIAQAVAAVTPGRAAGMTDAGWTMAARLRYGVPRDCHARLDP
jgi:hypothetical protein